MDGRFNCNTMSPENFSALGYAGIVPGATLLRKCLLYQRGGNEIQRRFFEDISKLVDFLQVYSLHELSLETVTL